MSQVSGLGMRKRVFLVFLFTLVLSVGLISRLAYIQFVLGEELRSEAVEVRMRDLQVQAKRGIIYDRRGRELAISINVDTVWAAPSQVPDPEKEAAVLAEVLEMDYHEILEKLRSRTAFVYIKRKISETMSKRLKDLELPGIYLTQDSKRFYPKGTLAAHVLGISGIDNQGLEGIELAYDENLRGKPGKVVMEFDARGQEIPQAEHRYLPPQDGYDLILTLDETIQFIAERELDAAMAQTGAKKGVVIVMDPKTGEILAMAIRPTFDPNEYQEYPAANRRIVAISDAFHPGSAFKPITAAAALEEGVVHVGSYFACGGGIVVSGWPIGCITGHGSVSFYGAIERSCNVSLIQMGLALGIDKFFRYVEDFGLTSQTGIDLPGEARGVIKPVQEMKKLDLAVMSFGQTLAVTPLQLVSALAAIANDGKLMRPHLAKRFLDRDGNVVKEVRPEVIRQVISPSTAAEIQKAMEGVILRGTGKQARVEGYRLAGKTGTAEKIQGVDGIYVAWFAGFGPVDDPRLATLVMLDEPQGAHYGGIVAAPVFAAVMRDSLHYLEVPARYEEKEEPWVPPGHLGEDPLMAVVPSVVNLPVDEAVKILREESLVARVQGKGDLVLEQVPPSGVEVPPGTRVLLQTTLQVPGVPERGGQDEAAQVEVPDLRGMTMREAAEILGKMGLRMQPEGSGKAVIQNPAPGQRVQQGTAVRVVFKDPRSREEPVQPGERD